MSDDTTKDLTLRDVLEWRDKALMSLAHKYSGTIPSDAAEAVNRLAQLARRVLPAPSFDDLRWALRNDPVVSAAYSLGRQEGHATDTSDPLLAAADEVIDAMLDPGSHPDYHYQQMTRLKDEWPALYEAIAVLIQARGRKVPLRVERGDPRTFEQKLRDSL